MAEEMEISSMFRASRSEERQSIQEWVERMVGALYAEDPYGDPVPVSTTHGHLPGTGIKIEGDFGEVTIRTGGGTGRHMLNWGVNREDRHGLWKWYIREHPIGIWFWPAGKDWRAPAIKRPEDWLTTEACHMRDSYLAGPEGRRRRDNVRLRALDYVQPRCVPRMREPDFRVWMAESAPLDPMMSSAVIEQTEFGESRVVRNSGDYTVIQIRWRKVFPWAIRCQCSGWIVIDEPREGHVMCRVCDHCRTEVRLVREDVLNER